MASEPYEPLNVQFGEVTDGCFSSTKYDVIYYPMEGKGNPSWKIIRDPDNSGKFKVEFRATGNGNGKTYGHTSLPFKEDVKQLLEDSGKSDTRNNYEVRIEKRHNLLKYFRKY